MSGCLGCQRCEADTVELIDGRQVCTWCEDYRAECEARAVLSMPKQARRDYLFGEFDHAKKLVKKGIAQQRGQEAADQLADLVRRVWDHARVKPE